MKPTAEQLRHLCPRVDHNLIDQHLSRLDDRYFQVFSPEQVCAHLEHLARLRPENPVEVIFGRAGGEGMECTVLAFDYPYLFSLITGTLAGLGFEIVSGEVFTYGRRYHSRPKRPRSGGSGRRPQSLQERRRIVDHFRGHIHSTLNPEDWAQEFFRRLSEIIQLLESGREDLVQKAKGLVNDMVVQRLTQLQAETGPILHPVQIEFDNSQPQFTRLLIESEDTPAFLYSLANALSLQGVSIEQVRIRTIGGLVQDQLDIVDAGGRPLDDPELINRVRLAVLLTKQFTYFLGKAPDPYAALCRYEALVQDVLRAPEQGRLLDTVTNPHALRELARLLGTSDYLWEDFIRGQYEALLPMLEPVARQRRFSTPVEKLRAKLHQALAGLETLEEKRQQLNQFKNREIFLIDLDHILNPNLDFQDLALQLTHLAEVVVEAAATTAYDHLRQRYGVPRNTAGLPAHYTIAGLGKLGGAALGYASDLEILFIYSDNGFTDGHEVVANSDFFDRLVRTILQLIEAKREGIFHVDLRLRPYGSAGPLATSLENFCRYYGPGGDAHAYERLALVRLRCIGGSRALGARVERLRDEMIYESGNVDIAALRSLRQKQFEEKTAGGQPNAKFSPGGLVDLEYDIQILQVLYGGRHPQLRTPKMHQALAALAAAGVLSGEEIEQLTAAYHFLRRLINAMRMLRGSAQDLFLPPPGSLEYAALARRMGYQRGQALGAAEQLRLDFETHTAAVRAFAERHFGRESLPGPRTGSMADLVLADQVDSGLADAVLTQVGFRQPRRALVNLRQLAGSGSRRRSFARLALVAADILPQTPDPDMALNNWERFARNQLSPEFHYNLMLSQPMRLEILLSIMAGSQFLADTLVQHPTFLDWLTTPEILHQPRSREHLCQELLAAADTSRTQESWRNFLRRIRKRETLRIGTRDMYLNVPADTVAAELSVLAESLVQAALERVWRSLVEHGEISAAAAAALRRRYCILALGKLGGAELNYSSDIDLLAFYDSSPSLAAEIDLHPQALKQLCARIMEGVARDLATHTEEGRAYRVDLRLRPYGTAGDLVPASAGMLQYYLHAASLWEVQALLKARPIAGSMETGKTMLEKLRPVFLQQRSAAAVVAAIDRLRRAAIGRSAAALASGIDLKQGVGGIRDIEFLVQGLQLLHAPQYPDLLVANNLEALSRLQQKEIIPAGVAARLRQDYLFLRRAEHYLQLLEDQQVHRLPREATALGGLARRVLGAGATAEQLLGELKGCTQRVHRIYEEIFLAQARA